MEVLAGLDVLPNLERDDALPQSRQFPSGEQLQDLQNYKYLFQEFFKIINYKSLVFILVYRAGVLVDRDSLVLAFFFLGGPHTSPTCSITSVTSMG